MPVGHAVEEHPVLVPRAVFHEGHVVTGLDAEHCKQLQLLPWDLLAASSTPALEFLWNVQPPGFVRLATVMGVNLGRGGSGRTGPDLPGRGERGQIPNLFPADVIPVLPACLGMVLGEQPGSRKLKWELVTLQEGETVGMLMERQQGRISIQFLKDYSLFMEWVFQESCGCHIPGIVQGQVGQSLEQSGIVSSTQGVELE